MKEAQTHTHKHREIRERKVPGLTLLLQTQRQQTKRGVGFYPKVKPCPFYLLATSSEKRRREREGAKVEKSRSSAAGIWSTGSQEVKDGCGYPSWLQGSSLPLDFQQH